MEGEGDGRQKGASRGNVSKPWERRRGRMQRERMSSTVESSPATPRTKPPELLSAHLIGRPHAVRRFPLLLIRPPPGTARSSRVAFPPPPPVLPDSKLLVCSGSVSPPPAGLSSAQTRPSIRDVLATQNLKTTPTRQMHAKRTLPPSSHRLRLMSFPRLNTLLLAQH